METVEYVFIGRLILEHPLEQQVPESPIRIIKFVEEVDADFDQHTVEVH